MLRIGISNVKCQVIAATKKSEETLWELLSEKVPNSYWTPAFQKGHWDGKKRFYNRGTRRFPSGLLPFTLKVFKEMGIRIDLVDLRGDPPAIKSVMSPSEWSSLLRSRQFPVEPLLSVYQHRAVTQSLHSTLPGTTIPWLRGGVSAPTAFGKTLTSFWIYLTLRRPFLLLYDRQDLFLQSIDVYEQLTGKECGRIGMGTWDPRKCTIAIIKTLHDAWRAEHPEAIKFLQSREVVIVDEAHQVKDNWYLPLLDSMLNASVRYAMSGSLLKRNTVEDWHFLGAFGETLYHLPSKTLRKKGLLSEVKVFLYDVHRPKSTARYHIAEKQCIIRNDYRNGIAVQIALRAAEKNWVTLLLVSKRDHGLRLKGMFEGFGLDVPFLCYKDPGKLRKQYLNAMRRGDCKIVIASGIFKMGVDVPLIRCLIRLDGGLSDIDSLQIPGRGMRRKGEYNWLYMVDFVDQTCDYFYDHSKRRLKIYKSEGYELHAVSDPTDIEFKDFRPKEQAVQTESEEVRTVQAL